MTTINPGELIRIPTTFIVMRSIEKRKREHSMHMFDFLNMRTICGTIGIVVSCVETVAGDASYVIFAKDIGWIYTQNFEIIT